jgi:membrane protein DedA with SNARE-associated domain
MLSQFILRWGYLALGFGTFFEGEAVLIAGGALAHRGLLSLPLVILAAFAGSVGGDQLWFQLGRHFGPRLLERRRHWQPRVAQVKRWLERYGALFVLSFRFLYGLRMISPLLLGATHYPAVRFAILNVVGAAIWACAFGFAGWAVGAGMRSVLSRAGHVEELLGMGVAVSICLWIAYRLWSRRSAKAVESASTLASERPSSPS